MSQPRLPTVHELLGRSPSDLALRGSLPRVDRPNLGFRTTAPRRVVPEHLSTWTVEAARLTTDDGLEVCRGAEGDAVAVPADRVIALAGGDPRVEGDAMFVGTDEDCVIRLRGETREWVVDIRDGAVALYATEAPARPIELALPPVYGLVQAIAGPSWVAERVDRLALSDEAWDRLAAVGVFLRHGLPVRPPSPAVLADGPPRDHPAVAVRTWLREQPAPVLDALEAEALARVHDLEAALREADAGGDRSCRLRDALEDVRVALTAAGRGAALRAALRAVDVLGDERSVLLEPGEDDPALRHAEGWWASR